MVYDITQAQSIERAKEWIEELNENAEPGIVVALVGNKCDLKEQRQLKKEVSCFFLSERIFTPRKSSNIASRMACCTLNAPPKPEKM